MKGTVEINGMRIFARHGVYDFERRDGNVFEVTVHLVYPMSGALVNDRLDDTLNYAGAVELVKIVMDTPSDLLENVAYRIKTALCDRYPLIEGGYIRVAKLEPPIEADLDSVAVNIRW